MLKPFALGLALAFTPPALAAELSDRYKVIGTMSVALGDEVLDLVIPFDSESGTAFAEQSMIMGQFLTLNSVGMTIGETGAPGEPLVQVTLQKQGSGMQLLSAEVFDDQGYDGPMVMGVDGGTGGLTAFSFENDRLEARIEGSFLRLTGYNSEPRVADGATPIAATITWSVDIPPMD